MVLQRRALCELIDFNSWTAVQAWIMEVAVAAYEELRRDYLAAFERRGERSPPGSAELKDHFARWSGVLNQRVDEEVARLRARGDEPRFNKRGWGILEHYEHFIIQALALDRWCTMQRPEGNHLSTREYARDIPRLFQIMYEFTNTLCHNHWKPETDCWDSDDSDEPYTDEADIPFPLDS